MTPRGRRSGLRRPRVNARSSGIVCVDVRSLLYFARDRRVTFYRAELLTLPSLGQHAHARTHVETRA